MYLSGRIPRKLSFLAPFLCPDAPTFYFYEEGVLTLLERKFTPCSIVVYSPCDSSELLVR